MNHNINECLRKGDKEIPFGYTSIAEIDGVHSDMLMDFGTLRMKKGDVFEEEKDLECAYLLVSGEVKFSWCGKEQIASRGNCFDDGAWVLHVPAGTKIKITGIGEDSELTVHRTVNTTKFEPKLFAPEDTPTEYRGVGTMKETCTRVLRTFFDKSNAPWSNLILGEVINYPGKWSSFPPHDHPQPEIYYYKINPSNGYGFSELGDNVLKVHNNDTVFIDGVTHPQIATPGHALWYMWVIRHLDDNPYITPHFLEEFDYLRNPDTTIWPDGKIRQY